MRLSYFKINGAGNTHLVIFSQDIPVKIKKSEKNFQKFLQYISSSHYGVEVDQILDVQSKNPMRFQVWNKDGSAAAMCGNGARAIMHLAASEDWLPFKDQQLWVSGNPCEARIVENNHFAISMGKASLAEEKLVKIDSEEIWTQEILLGNSHMIVPMSEHKKEFWQKPKDFSVSIWGPKLESYFQSKSNIQFVDLDKDPVFVSPWELGAGATLACGSGAVAVASFIAKLSTSSMDTLSIRMPGGNLSLDFAKETIFLRGEAKIEASGELNIELNI